MNIPIYLTIIARCSMEECGARRARPPARALVYDRTVPRCGLHRNKYRYTLWYVSMAPRILRAFFVNVMTMCGNLSPVVAGGVTVAL